MIQLLTEYIWKDRAQVVMWYEARDVKGAIMMFDKDDMPTYEEQKELVLGMSEHLCELPKGMKYSSTIRVGEEIDPRIKDQLMARRN